MSHTNHADTFSFASATRCDQVHFETKSPPALKVTSFNNTSQKESVLLTAENERACDDSGAIVKEHTTCMVIGNDARMVHSRASPVPELTNVLTALQCRYYCSGRETPQITILFSWRRRKKSSFQGSPAPCFKSFLNSFSSPFKVDCISLRVSALFLALAPTGKATTKRLLVSRNFSCKLLLPCGPRWTLPSLCASTRSVLSVTSSSHFSWCLGPP